MAGDDVKMLIESAAPALKQKLFQGAGFSLEEACRIVSEFMFDRYGVSNYKCGAAVQTALESYFDAQPELRRDSAATAWQPRG